MKIEDGRKLAINLMKRHHISPMFNFKFSHGKKTIGWCNYEHGNYYIAISKHFIENNNKKRVTEVILHEVAHALDFMVRGFSYHDDFWKSICHQIGCSGNRLIN